MLTWGHNGYELNLDLGELCWRVTCLQVENESATWENHSLKRREAIEYMQSIYRNRHCDIRLQSGMLSKPEGKHTMSAELKQEIIHRKQGLKRMFTVYKQARVATHKRLNARQRCMSGWKSPEAIDWKNLEGANKLWGICELEHHRWCKNWLWACGRVLANTHRGIQPEPCKARSDEMHMAGKAPTKMCCNLQSANTHDGKQRLQNK